MCAVMVLVFAAPVALAQTEHTITKGDKGPSNSAITWEYTPTAYGMWTGNISNNGLRSLVVDVEDITGGTPIEIFHQRIRFAAWDAYPTGEVNAGPVTMAVGHVYAITGTPNGPKGTSCVVTDTFAELIPPVAMFNYSVLDATVSVDASGSYDPDGTIVSYEWSWGDGTTGTGVMASHTYSMTNTYDITLVVTDNDDATASRTESVYVYVAVNNPPVPAFDIAVSDLTVSVDASASYDPEMTALTYAWNWGDGSTGSGVTASHTYAAYGTYTITLTVTDAGGLSASLPQSVTLAPSRTVSHRVSNMFELYLKSTVMTDLGRWTGTSGANSYFSLRTAYQEYFVQNTYPFLYAYNPYSTRTVPDINAGFVITSWYRFYTDATGIDTIGTGPGMDPVFMPVLGNSALPGGNVDIQWYSTYLTTTEMTNIRTYGTHYANTYYGVPTRSTPGPASDDGYWHELQGKITYDRGAAAKLLGIPGTGDLRTEFAAAEATIEGMWFDDWMIEGGSIYDIYTAYDYSDDIRWVELTVDPASTADNLILRFWTMSWGNEVLLVRYMEAAGVWTNLQAWPDDWYLNITMGLTQADIHSRAVMGYHLTAWEDQTNKGIGAWNFEAVHMDWCANDPPLHTSYASPYNTYDPDSTDVLKTSWLPGTVNFGKQVSYWLAPREWDFAAGESITIQLPTGPVPGITPYIGTSDSLTSTKLAEILGKVYTGSMSMGVGWPTNLGTYYDPATKTLTMVGPIDLATLINSYGVMETGAPTFMFTVV